MDKAKAIDFAKELPTRSDPLIGPCVNAIADNCSLSMFALQCSIDNRNYILLVCEKLILEQRRHIGYEFLDLPQH
jgi:hypothetical protein